MQTPKQPGEILSPDQFPSLDQGTPLHAVHMRWSSNADAALYWFRFGLQIIPLIPGTKKTAVKWDSWFAGLSAKKIAAYWKQHPDHELGFIVGDDLIVFDADSPLSIAALTGLEESFGITPGMIVKTTKGEHHYFRRAKGTVAIQNSHSTADHPERLDVKTGRALIILPPSTGKTLITGMEDADIVRSVKLAEVDQDFIDAVFLHNGMPPPRLSITIPRSTSRPKDGHLRLLQVLLNRIDANCGYDDWTHVGMALHRESAGSDQGYELYDAWSSTGKTYKGSRETAAKWRSFRSDYEGGYTKATLFRMAQKAGFSTEDIYDEAEPFEMLEGEDGTS